MVRVAAGLMSGTSMDGVDAALIATDGERRLRFLATAFVPYPDGLRRRLARLLGKSPPYPNRLRDELTACHIQATKRLKGWRDAEVIGFAGQTIVHLPALRQSHQLAGWQQLADALGIAVVGEFRRRDMENGGQGAPLVPLFHQSLFADERELAVVNLGGVANITFLRRGLPPLAGDVGPGIGLIDDCVRGAGRPVVDAAELAAKGRVADGPLAELLRDDWLARPPPKSLDRQDFAAKTARALHDLSLEDKLATLTAFSAGAIKLGLGLLGGAKTPLVLSGGGRKNRALKEALVSTLKGAVTDIDDKGFDGDFLEAQAFAWLAVRHLANKPLSLPTTTGCAVPSPGGRLYRPKKFPEASLPSGNF